MQFVMEANIVGMRFRPPAEDVVRMLPAGAKLKLERDHANQYDLNAVKVLLVGFNAEGEHKELYNKYIAEYTEAAAGDEAVLAELMERLTDPFWLGFVCNNEKTGGKKADLLCAQLDPLGDEAWAHSTPHGTLTFSARGGPMVNIDIEIAEHPPQAIEADAPEEPGSDFGDNWDNGQD